MSIFDLANQAQSPSMGGTGGIGALADNTAYPLSRMDKTQYSVPRQLPTSAEVISSDYDPKTDAFTGMPQNRFAAGGIASIPRFDGEEGSQVEAPAAWSPESGQVKLSQLTDPKDPFSETKQIDYTIPKDQIKTFIPNLDQETGQPNGSGAYVLKDGSTLGVDNFGVVSAATPGRNDYTLNKDGYYQPTGANLTWDGGNNMLTKKIGGVDVQVPGLYHKGGYQNQDGSLRVNEEGVPVPLAPNYLDSGFGKSGLADAAPYIAIAAMTAATMGAASPAAGGFAGMVPASETLLGSMGMLGTAAAPTVAGSELLGSTAGISSADLGLTPYIASSGGEGALGSTVGLSTADLGTTPYIASSGGESALGSTAGISSADLGTTPYIGNQGAPVYDFSAPYSGPLNYAGEAAKTAKLTTGQKLAALSLASGAMKSSGGSGGSAGPTATTTTTQAAPTQNIASNNFNPSMSMPNMFAMNQSAPGAYYQPQTYRYYAQGGVADLGGYAAGGKLLKGPGDGMSDSIVANIAGKQPARLADGEFVVPADVVSHLGNGSTDAGAKHLYKMMDRIRQARTGNSKQGKRINPDKFLPKG